MKVTLAFGVLVIFAPASTLAGPVFLGLGDLPGGTAFSRAQGVSADGTTVVGASRSAQGLEAFRWTFEGGMIGLGDLPGGEFRSEAFDVSANGSVVLGSGRTAAGSKAQGFRWEGGIMTPLGGAEQGWSSSHPSAVSTDGTVVVGGGGSALGFQAFRWTAQSGFIGLGDLPEGRFQSQAKGVSDDGSVIVGSSLTETALDGEAFRWTTETGMVGLGFLPGGGDVSRATAVSADGTVIVGTSDLSAGGAAFRWTTETEMVALGSFLPLSLSADGSMIAGVDFPGSETRAIIWDETNGVRGVRNLLEIEFGLDLTGWTLTSANDISADGTVIVGIGINPLGQTEAFVAVIPEPDVSSLLFFGMLAVVRRQG